MFATFYSFKGGVGRSMALANIAEIFSRQKLRVLMVDFDLEAPGLERYFDKAKAATEPDQVQERRGIIDLLESYKELRSLADVHIEPPSTSFPVEPLSNFVVPLYESSSERQSVSLIPAGMRGPGRFAEYARRVRAFDWDDFYARWEGERFFEWFRTEAEKISDVVLVDSRTGVSEMSGVCTYQLADTVAMFVAPNQQNLDGVRMMAEALADPHLIEGVRKGRPLTMLCVPSRVEQSEAVLLDQFAKRFNRLFGKVTPPGLTFDKDAFIDLKIPYVPYYSYMERVAIREPTRASAADMSGAYQRIARALAQVAPEIRAAAEFKRLASAPSGGVATPAPPAETGVERSFRTTPAPEQGGGQHDVFISYSREDAAWARRFHESLSAAGLRVYQDTARLTAGAIWDQSLDKALRDSRHLLVLQSPAAGTSDWVLREAALFDNLGRGAQQRKLISVNLEGEGLRHFERFELINDLRDARTYSAGPDRVDSVLWRRVVELIVESIGGLTPIPLAVLAMTEREAQQIEMLNTVPSFGVSLKQLLVDLGLGQTDLLALYGPRPGDWRPFGSDRSIEQLLGSAIGTINGNLGSESGAMRFRWSPIDPLGWSERETARQDAARFLSAAMSVLVLDPLSLYHPFLFQILAMLSDGFYSQRSLILVLSPVPPPPGTLTLMRAMQERGRPFFDAYFAPLGKQREYATVETNVNNDTDLERVLQRSIATEIQRQEKGRSILSPLTQG